MKPLVLAALAAAPFLPTTPQPGAEPAAGVQADPFGFPVPSEGMVLNAPDDDPLTLVDLVHAYGEATGQTILYSDEARNFLESSRVNLAGPLEVPAARVQTTFEAILASHDFLLIPLTDQAPRLLEVVSLQTGARNNVRQHAVLVDEEHLAAAAGHPAVLCTTVIDLPNTDVRQLSNSMRTMITDANTQQMLPAGNTNSLVLVGTGTSVADLVRMLRLIDRASEGGDQKEGAGK